MTDYTLHLGDCLEYMATMPDASVDAVITDPPYLTGNARVPIRGRGVTEKRLKSESVGLPWGYDLQWIDACARLNPKHWCVYANYKMLPSLMGKLEQYAEIACVFVWRKSNAPRMTRPVPRLDSEFIVWAKGKGATNGNMKEFSSMVLDVPMPQAGCFAVERVLEKGSKKAAHPTQKPIAVVQPFVERLPIEIVFDPFMGTGTTGVACINTGRKFIGCELEPKYFEIAKQRIETATMQPALLREAAD